MYNFSKLSVGEIDSLINILIEVGNLGTTQDHTTAAIADALDNTTFGDSLKLATSARQQLGEIYDKLACTDPSQQADAALRQRIIAWLAMNDRNGEYTDDDMLAEGMQPNSLEQVARELVRQLDQA